MRTILKKETNFTTAAIVGILFLSSGCSLDKALTDLDSGILAVFVQPPQTSTPAEVGVLPTSLAAEILMRRLGVGFQTGRIRAIYSQYQNSFSDLGDPQEINASMYMGYLQIAAAVCYEMLEKERQFEPNQRVYTRSVNFDDPNLFTALDSSNVDITIEVLVRSILGRPSKPEEKAILRNTYDLTRNEANSSGGSIITPIGAVCVSIAGSMDAVKI